MSFVSQVQAVAVRLLNHFDVDSSRHHARKDDEPPLVSWLAGRTSRHERARHINSHPFKYKVLAILPWYPAPVSGPIFLNDPVRFSSLATWAAGQYVLAVLLAVEQEVMHSHLIPQHHRSP